MPAQPLGSLGEDIAARALERHGWTLLHRNYRFGHKEIDLVARHGEVVAFVEVKTRASAGFGHPLEAITSRKRREIQQVAAAWIQRHGHPSDVYRFDAIAVFISEDRPPRIEHVEDAWRI